MEGPLLTGGLGAEPPEWPKPRLVTNRRSDVYMQRMYAFEHLFDFLPSKSRKRRQLSDYTAKNCEEASAERYQG